jgi:signal transduction histidine kinase
MAKFRTKARAVDHLGKGQIADLPTAISELWKNGYDAYADEVSCDLYQVGYKGITESIFTLSDDGFGMTKADLENKWIVLGTDSKTRGMLPLTEKERLGKAPRIPLGEKGIGRLSIAYLGSPILMLTKKEDENAYLVFVDWRILENHNLYIEDFDIPIIPINSSKSINEQLDDLTGQFSSNLSSGNWSEHKILAERIRKDLDEKRLPNFLDEEIKAFFSAPKNHGTYIVAFNPHHELSAMDAQDLDSKDNEQLNYLRTSLNGMTNAFKDEQPIATSFKIHHESGMYDLVARNRFFTSHDMYHGDHWIKGKFNDEGEFNGSVQVYNENFDFLFKPNRAPGKTPYGPLAIELGWLEGQRSATKLSEKTFDILNKKLTNFGGLYIYRDGFRVLPYGRLEYDWLKFEERRSRSAGYYHFSHRRMMGYISISRENNPKLIDKAGREGFVANQAYHELQKDLIEFFIDVSLRFFRRTQDKNDDPTSRQRQIADIEKKNERLLKQEKKKGNITLTSFKREIRDNEGSLTDLELTGTKIKDNLQVQATAKNVEIHQVEELLQELNDVKDSLRKLKLVKPRRFNLDASLEKKYFEYCEKFEAANQIIVECEAVVEQLRDGFSVETLENEYNARVKLLRSSLVRQLQEFRKRIVNSLDPIVETVDLDLSQIPGRFDIERSKLERAIGTAKQDYSLLKNELERTASEFYQEQEERYLPLVKHLEGLDVGVDDDALMLWYKEKYEQIEEKVEAMHELSQLGMAIEIIDHQFNVLYSEIGNGLQTLKSLVDNNPEYQYGFKQLRSAFEHLETNHQLLAPLYRTTRRSRSEITGGELYEYLGNFFKKRFKENNITFICDQSFEKYCFFTFDSVIKPVFINLINNAVYWLKSVSDRTIVIKVKNDKILVQNNGQPIDNFYLNDIFKLFFTRTPGGRGIGLYLARSNLETIGYKIEASNDRKYNELKGACFIIEEVEGV